FFSSRRRHTRWPRDWSSDVCSSDLVSEHLLRPPRPPLESADAEVFAYLRGVSRIRPTTLAARLRLPEHRVEERLDRLRGLRAVRSEERRVGKECRSGWWAGHVEKKD